VGAHKNDDIAVNAGKAYVILGGSLSATGTLSLSSADLSFLGEAVDDEAGTGVGAAGDVDGDGLDDLIIGAPNNDPARSLNNAGSAYLVLGSSLSSSGQYNLDTADWAFYSNGSGDETGGTTMGAGDMNNDGLDDLLIGAPGYNPIRADDEGRVYLVFSQL
jgi:hypothetical protein